MKIKIALLLIAHVAIGSFLYAQVKVKTFIKGDIVPAQMVIGKMVNHKMNQTKFSAFRGKLLILDFWSTHCSPCVAGLPRMDSLQRKYGNKIVIIPITSEKYAIIQDYFKKKKFKLPSVVEDKILSKAFPQTALDLHVWLDQKGKIIATTSGEDVNFKTIDEYFETGRVNANERIDIVGGFDSTKPLFVNGNGGSGNPFLGRSILTNARLIGEQTGGFQLEYYPDINQKYMIKGVKMWNGSPINIFFKILSGLEPSMNFSFLYKELENGKVIPFSDSNESSQFYNAFDKYINVKGDGVINYELIIPSPGASPDVFLRNIY